MPNTTDLLNKTFERLTVKQYVGQSPHGHSIWLCECSCGKRLNVLRYCLTTKNTRSCGCLKSEQTTKQSYKHGGAARGKIEHLCFVWYWIQDRCNNPKCSAYKDYGARGIKNLFIDYPTFRTWALNNGYQKGLTIDRINNNESYSPENCHWTTQKIQCNNKRNNIYLTYKEKTQTLTQWAEELNMPYRCLQYRYQQNWTIEKILTTQKFKNKGIILDEN